MLELVKAIATFGGALVIIVGLIAFIAKQVAKHTSSAFLQLQKAELNKELEKHKDSLGREADHYRLLLKRQELMFEREYAAASDFFRYFRSVVPEPWAPHLDWSDAQREIADRFGFHRDALNKFLDKHSASLSEKTRVCIKRASSQATEGVFEVGLDTRGGDYEYDVYPNEVVREYVDSFYDALVEAEKSIRRDLEGGSFSKTPLPR